jgi:spermidine synthase
MYHLPGIGLTAIILYLLSYTFYKAGFYPLQLHRKLWNSILSITFIITAIAGLFLALQASYKWEIANIKSVLKWHVEFGIGMAFTGLFHFTWHFSYFGDLIKPAAMKQPQAVKTTTIRGMSINLFLIGFVSTSVQLLLLREMMNISGGYELISGIFLASWLSASSIGSLLAGRYGMDDIRKINLSFSLGPLISLLLLLTLSRILLHPGQTPSFLTSLIYTFIVLLPFCVITGYTFIRLLSIAKSLNGYNPGKSFALETTGGIIAGVTISTLTSGILNTYQLLLLITILINAWSLTSFIIERKSIKSLTKIIALLVASASIIFNPDILFRQILIPGVKVVNTTDTPYGNITTGIYKGEESIYYDHRLLNYSGDVAEREENIHYAMLQHNKPNDIILISGSLNSSLIEIAKYKPEGVTFIERDPFLAVQQHGTEFPGLKVKIANEDAYMYIKKMKEQADVMIMLIPPPSNLLLNRYYSKEFFHEVAAKLGMAGVFLCSPGPADTYLNNESILLYSSVYNSLKSQFRHVLPISGNKLYFLASNNYLSSEICRLAESRKINNTYVSADFLSDDLIDRRSEEIISSLSQSTSENKASVPLAYKSLQAYSFGKTKDQKTIFIILAILLFALPVLSVGRRNALMFLSAFSLAGFEIILLLLLQITAGNIYQLTGILFAALMAGLASGAGIDQRLVNALSIRRRMAILLLFYVIAGSLFNLLSALDGKILPSIIMMILAFIPAFLTGNIFSELSRMGGNDQVISEIYAADLAGSSLGFLLTAAIMIPLIGLQYSIFLMSLFIFAGLLLGTVWNKQ